MLLIAHRGLTNGPNPTLENSPTQITNSINLGFDCEIDFWKIYNKFFLGHDEPQYEVDESFFFDSSMWIHAKNIQALEWLTGLTNKNLNFFWHQSDDYTITSKGYIWTYPGKIYTDKSICVMPEQFLSIEKSLDLKCYGICSDYVDNLRKMM